jgi:hypothetical protein
MNLGPHVPLVLAGMLVNTTPVWDLITIPPAPPIY